MPFSALECSKHCTLKFSENQKQPIIFSGFLNFFILIIYLKEFVDNKDGCVGRAIDESPCMSKIGDLQITNKK